MRGARQGIALAFATLVALAVPAAASAFYGNGAQIVSADFQRLEQGDDTTVFAAISADGRYAAIQTLARNFFVDGDPDPPGRYRAGGVFRFDLETKALEKVADGDLFDEASRQFLRRGASNPSINADGRYVAFASTEQLVPSDTNDNVDVYVRDMEVPIEVPGAFDLVSARDGGDSPAAYGAPANPFPGSEPGTDVAPGVSISADGQRVAFRTSAPSDLPASASADVPADQIFLRDRAANTTSLVTAVRDSGTGAMTDQPAGGATAVSSGAALSADGTTVAWTGRNANAQTRFLGGENVEPSFVYYLWRRMADGLGAPTRRVTGAADPDDPACPPGAVSNFNRTATGPCYGPLADAEGGPASISAQLPALSGDGYTVAFLTGSGPRGLDSSNPGLDLYVTRMNPGSTRKATTVELTRDTIGDPATSPPLSGVAMSAGARYLAITTVRTRFALPTLRLLGDPRPVPGPRELYVVDLQDRTLERVARSAVGNDVDADALSGATLSADGSRVAFVSFAGNLFFGDANQRADAFVAERQPDQGTGPPPVAKGLGAIDTIETEASGPRIRVRAQSRAGGLILLTVSVPAAGGVKAVGRARAGTPRKARALGVAKGRAKGRTRTTVRLQLRPVRRYRRELRLRKTIPGRVAITYVASRGGRRATASTRVVFRQAVEENKPGRGGLK